MTFMRYKRIFYEIFTISSVVKIYIIRHKPGPVAKNATPRPSGWEFNWYQWPPAEVLRESYINTIKYFLISIFKPLYQLSEKVLHLRLIKKIDSQCLFARCEFFLIDLFKDTVDLVSTTRKSPVLTKTSLSTLIRHALGRWKKNDSMITHLFPSLISTLQVVKKNPSNSTSLELRWELEMFYRLTAF